MNCLNLFCPSKRTKKKFKLFKIFKYSNESLKDIKYITEYLNLYCDVSEKFDKSYRYQILKINNYFIAVDNDKESYFTLNMIQKPNQIPNNYKCISFNDDINYHNGHFCILFIYYSQKNKLNTFLNLI